MIEMNRNFISGANIQELTELTLMNIMIFESGGGWVWLPQFNIRPKVVDNLVKAGLYKINGKNITRVYLHPDQHIVVNWWVD